MSDVFWVDLTRMSFDNSVTHKLRRLVGESGLAAGLSAGMRVALKVNTAEDGYDYGLRPGLVRALASAAQEATGTRPAICDGLKLADYWNSSKGHSFLHVARTKGYAHDTLGGSFAINGGFSGDEGNLYSCDRTDSVLGGVEVGAAVCRSDALWVFSHVTLHPFNQRLIAEDLVRVRRPDERERYAASQRYARIDPNPQATEMEQHIYEYREGASGATGTTGGGCGCN